MLVYPKPSLPKNIFDPGGALVGAVEGPKVEKWGLFKRVCWICWAPRIKNWLILVKMEVDWLTEKVLEGSYALFLRNWRF